MGVARELLAQRQRRRILRVGPANLDDAVEFFDLLLQRAVQLLQPRQQHVPCGHCGGDMHGGGESVVRRLAHVAVIVRVHRVFRADGTTHQFDRAIGNDLISVHVRLGAGTGLPDDEREVVVELALKDFASGLNDRLTARFVERTLCHIGLRAGLLNHAKRADNGDRLLFPPNREVDNRALCLRAPIFIGGNFERTKAVGFGAGIGHCAAPAVTYCCPAVYLRLTVCAMQGWR